MNGNGSLRDDTLRHAVNQLASFVVTHAPVQGVLRWLVREDSHGQSPLSRLFTNYANGNLNGGGGLAYVIPFAALDMMNRISGITKDYAIEKI